MDTGESGERGRNRTFNLLIKSCKYIANKGFTLGRHCLPLSALTYFFPNTYTPMANKP